MSLVDEPGEFQEKKVGVLGAAAAFISSLSIGQDMTRVSLPAIFFLPYSNLEMVASRTMGLFHIALRANRESDPESRFLQVVRWMLSMTRKENVNKKPYNPIVGETHRCWSSSPEFGKTVFFAEQVSHHPPVSAFVIFNEQEGVRLEGNVDYGIRFHGNSASVETKGELKLMLANGEQYIFSKILPPLMVKNVVLGTKRLVWEGSVSLRCPQSGLAAHFEYKEETSYWMGTCTNLVAGTVSAGSSSPPPAAASTPAAMPPASGGGGGGGVLLYTFQGVCGEAVTLTPVGGKRPATTLLEPAGDAAAQQQRRQVIEYGPSDSWDALSSLRVWKAVNGPIVADDLYAADRAKRQVEEAQRARRAAGASYEPIFFRPDRDGFWTYVDGTEPAALAPLLERRPLARQQPSLAASSPASVSAPGVALPTPSSSSGNNNNKTVDTATAPAAAAGIDDDDDDDVVLSPTETDEESVRRKLLELATHDDIEPVPADAAVSLE